MLPAPLLGLGDEEEADLADWNLPLAFMKKRHCEKIEGSKSLAQSWRMKDRVSASAPAAPGTCEVPAQGAQSREHVLGPRGVLFPGRVVQRRQVLAESARAVLVRNSQARVKSN